MLAYRWSVLAADASPIEVVCSFQIARFLSLRAIEFEVPARRNFVTSRISRAFLIPLKAFSPFLIAFTEFFDTFDSFYLSIRGITKMSC